MPAHESMALRLPADVIAVMRTDIARVAEMTIAAVISDVPSYSDPFRGAMGRNIQVAVRVALDGFLDLASRTEGIDSGDRIEAVMEAAYSLGRGEARSGRTMDALSQAYRVGARVAWREMSTAAVTAGLEATVLARLAELVFAFIDELSDASVSGHADELATTGRLRERRLERLAARLLSGEAQAELVAAAERADWEPPKALVAVILPEPKVRGLRNQLDAGTLVVAEDTVGDLDNRFSVLLVPATSPRSRAVLLRLLPPEAILGPTRPWTEVRASYLRVLSAHRLGLTGDSDLHLAHLVVDANPEALADLRARVLAPLGELSPTSREKLTETLRAWLLHQGRRDDVAEALFVHAQTVRYRMGQIRDLYGETLTDPEFVRDAVIALG